MTQSEAYTTALELASQHHWTKVLECMQEDGFDSKMDYITLLELWKWDSEGN